MQKCLAMKDFRGAEVAGILLTRKIQFQKYRLLESHEL